MDYENLDDLQVPHGNSESVFLPHRAEVELLPVSGLPPSPVCALRSLLTWHASLSSLHEETRSPFLGDSEDAET